MFLNRALMGLGTGVLVLTLVAVCGRPAGAPPDAVETHPNGATGVPLIGKWRLQSYGPVEEPVSVPEDLHVTIWFGPEQLQAWACNYLQSEYTAHGQTLEAGPLASTAMACIAGELMRLDGVLQRGLQASPTFAVDGDFLSLSTAGDVLCFTRLSAHPLPRNPTQLTTLPPLPEPSSTPVSTVGGSPC